MEQFWFVFCLAVFSITVAYILGFLLVVLIGILKESKLTSLRKKSIRNRVRLGMTMCCTEADMAERLPKPCTHTLGGVIDEMVRLNLVIRTGVLKPTPHWIITRHPQLR